MENPFFEQGTVLRELQNFENKIEEEYSKETVDNEKIMKIRYEQLMKGIMMTQNPYYL